jgi:Kef-type K+ transport system membrane component KefB
LRVVGTAFGFVIAAIVIGSWLAPYLIRLIERIDIARGLFFASMMFAFLLAYIAQQAGSAIIIGAFAAGLVLSRTERAEQIEREVHDIGQVFVPIFFVVVGAAVDLASINPFKTDARRFFLIGLLLTAVGVAGKVLAGFATLRRGMKRSIIGVGMIPRGEVGLVFAQIGLSAKLLTGGLYSAVAMMVILTTLMTPLLLRVMLARREREELRTGTLVTDAMNDGERRRSDRRESPGAVEVP